MFSDNLNRINVVMYEPMVEIVLRSLELYAYNLHYINKKYCDDYELENIFLKYAYDDILSSYNSQKYQHGYNLSDNCQSVINNMKRQKFYKFKKNIA